MKTKQLLLLTLFFAIQYISAQFTIDGQFRPRTEYRNGYNNLIADGADAGFGLSTRARLNFGYKNESYKLYMSLQDVITWGENRQLLSIDANNSFSLFEAWGASYCV